MLAFPIQWANFGFNHILNLINATRKLLDSPTKPNSPAKTRHYHQIFGLVKRRQMKSV